MTELNEQLAITVPLSLFSKLSYWLGKLAEAIEDKGYLMAETDPIATCVREIKKEVDAVIADYTKP